MDLKSTRFWLTILAIVLFFILVLVNKLDATEFATFVSINVLGYTGFRTLGYFAEDKK